MKKGVATAKSNACTLKEEEKAGATVEPAFPLFKSSVVEFEGRDLLRPAKREANLLSQFAGELNKAPTFVTLDPTIFVNPEITRPAADCDANEAIIGRVDDVVKLDFSDFGP